MSKKRVQEEQEYNSGSNQYEEERDVEDEDEGSECNITNDDLDKIANLVDVIKEIYAEVDEENVKEVSTDIDNNIQSIMMDLGNKLTPELAQEVASVYNLNAKFAFYNVCFTKAYEILTKVDSKIASVFSAIQDTNVFVVSKFTDKLLSLHPTITDLIQRLEEVEHEKKGGPKSSVKQMEEEILKLKQENMNAMDKIIRQSKEIDRLKKDRDQKIPAKNKPENEEKEHRPSHKRTEDNHEVKYTSVQPKGPCLLDWQNMGQNIGKANKRVVTVKQVKDLIEEIATSKQKSDSRCLESPIARETMEQHMYNYLNQKFGLRSLVVEWASALVNCLKSYWSKDNDCAVFAMILRNECDEEFRGIQKQVKSTIQELFKTTLKNKNPTKKNLEILKILSEKFKGHITQEECTEILRYIYNDEDYKEIIAKVEENLQIVENKIGQGRLAKEGKKKLMIKYSHFEKIILDFQLKSHHHFLSKFISIFRVYDPNNFGYINEEQFRDMMGTIDPDRKVDIQKLLHLIDPHEMNVVPFSACVSVFSAEPISEDEEGVTTILQYISNEHV